MKTLQVQGRYLCWDNGDPFFYLGDTAWEILHRLNRNEMEHFFAQRARQGFTVIQAVALAEFEGVTVPNAYGRLPLQFTNGLPDPAKPDLADGYSYWAHVDFAVECAAKHGLFLVLLPTWGDKFNLCWGKGPEIFTEENAQSYGRFIAQRYKDNWNIIWMLGGDRPLEAAHRRIVDAMAAGIRAVDGHHLITFHPPGAQESTSFVGDADYIDFHTAQTGHGIEKCYTSDGVMLKMQALSDKPFMDSEPRYEDHPACFDTNLGLFWGADEVRQNAYWNVFAGACGHTYGNHSIWSMTREASAYFPFTWQDALLHEGAEQVGFVKQLRLSRDYASLRHAPELLLEHFEGMGHMVAAMGTGYAYAYSPLGVPFTLDLDGFKGAKCLKASWFDPREGKEALFAVLPAEGKNLFVPPSQGKGCDWVLILDAVQP